MAILSQDEPLWLAHPTTLVQIRLMEEMRDPPRFQHLNKMMAITAIATFD